MHSPRIIPLLLFTVLLLEFTAGVFRDSFPSLKQYRYLRPIVSVVNLATLLELQLRLHVLLLHTQTSKIGAPFSVHFLTLIYCIALLWFDLLDGFISR